MYMSSELVLFRSKKNIIPVSKSENKIQIQIRSTTNVKYEFKKI